MSYSFSAEIFHSRVMNSALSFFRRSRAALVAEEKTAPKPRAGSACFSSGGCAHFHGRLIINETPTFGSCSMNCQGLPPSCSLWTLTGSPLGGCTDGGGRDGSSVNMYLGPDGGVLPRPRLLVRGSILSLGIPDHVMGNQAPTSRGGWQWAQVPSTRHGPPTSLPSLSPAPGLAHHRTSKCAMHEGKSVFSQQAVYVCTVCACVCTLASLRSVNISQWVLTSPVRPHGVAPPEGDGLGTWVVSADRSLLRLLSWQRPSLPPHLLGSGGFRTRAWLQTPGPGSRARNECINNEDIREDAHPFSED